MSATTSPAAASSSVSLEDLRRAVASMKRLDGSDMIDPFALGCFGDMRIIVDEPKPKVQLSESCPCSDKFRAEMNLWLRSFFGVTTALPPNTCIRFSNYILMSRFDANRLASITAP